MAGLNANGLPLTDTRPENGAPAESPELPGRGGASIGSVAKAVARELVSDLVEFAVDVAYGPGTACLGELLTQGVGSRKRFLGIEKNVLSSKNGFGGSGLGCRV